MAVFLLGFAGVTAMGLAAARQVAAAGHRQHAADIATSLIELSRILPAAVVPTLAATTTNFDAFGRPVGAGVAQQVFYRSTFTVLPVTSDNTQLYSVTARVQWLEPYLQTMQTFTLTTHLPGP